MSSAERDLDPSAATEVPRLRVFTTPTCGYCKMVKQWLTERGCAYEELDITADVEVLREWRRISGGAGVPVTAFGSDIVIGFNPQRLEQFIASCRNTTRSGLPADDGD